MATKSTVFCTSGKDLVKKATLEESRGFGPYDVRAGVTNISSLSFLFFFLESEGERWLKILIIDTKRVA